MRRRAAVALGLSVLLLGIFISLVGWDDVLDSIERASLSVYAIAIVGSLITLAFRSEVWRRVLSVVDQPRPYWLVASVFTTATFIKYVTPYGQVASGVGNAAIVSRYTDAAYEESLAAVVSADVMTYVPYYTFGFVGVVYLFSRVSPPIDPRPYLFPAVGMVAIFAFLALFLWTQRSRLKTAIVRALVGFRGVVARISPRRAGLLTRENVERRLQDFTLTLELVSRNRRSMTLALVYAHMAWLGLALALYASAAAVGTPLPVGIVLLSVALSKLGFIVPTPGGLGGVEATLATVVYLLAPSDVGMTVATATAIAILYRFATYWLTVAVGGTTSVALTIVDPRPVD
ncbi:lysylphosphatidylglycerol synthase transmembrane domain-containing protein [Natronosalvus vescus]|uniref:lysylphosphatidylglycerol synthase transmembrane domain-containing protein n=1 Tax=Natronosalvus vescus TaxID=2953881 RepID=UPI002090DCC8|nr:lysylphosphatidylglycerol synthase transmembrane domain-containing protein [Natronosalvus vescus]